MRHQVLEPMPAPTYDAAVPEFETLLSSDGRGWNHLQVYSYRLERQPDLVAAPIVDAHTLPLLLKGTTEISGFLDSRAVRAQVCPGIVGLTPRATPSAYRWTHGCVVAHLHLSPTPILAAAADLGRGDPERVELVPTPFFRDPFIEQLCRELLDELGRGGLLGALYADTLAHALALHLLRHHSSLSATRTLPDRGLSEQHLRLVRDFIDDALATDIGLDALAALTGMSPACFTRNFKRSVGLPPHQYLIHRRVERAKELLSGSASSVAEVSQAVGFFDQSHLVRHFKYWVGVTPRDFRDGKLRT